MPGKSAKPARSASMITVFQALFGESGAGAAVVIKSATLEVVFAKAASEALFQVWKKALIAADEVSWHSFAR